MAACGTQHGIDCNRDLKQNARGAVFFRGTAQFQFAQFSTYASARPWQGMSVIVNL
jgi:hypothetical protein